MDGFGVAVEIDDDDRALVYLVEGSAYVHGSCKAVDLQLLMSFVSTDTDYVSVVFDVGHNSVHQEPDDLGSLFVRVAEPTVVAVCSSYLSWTQEDGAPVGCDVLFSVPFGRVVQA